MKFIVCVTFLFLCTPDFLRSKAVDENEKKGEAEGYKRAVKKPDVDQCTDKCYLKYFLSKSVPTGLDLSNSQDMSCICQKDNKGNDYFATYFYDDAGIAAYSAYTIQASDAGNIGMYGRPPDSWKTTPGITKQGTNALYAGSGAHKMDKGHLNPSHINSYDQNHQIATFKYTNAVPQFPGHNRISWRQYEAKIANYVKDICGKAGGNMHLITGTSNYLRSTTGQQLTGKIEYFPPNNPSAIMRTNS
ncbi:PREDICTED: nuclease-like isoform X2 [Acropora digitifera]|uniref:nuclease-like isoform X2 n=1 Tax=Acropora digitifera TaxID=70779 RepID=UPI00077A52DC|nr:PREDICTED: nuclease-like isoform X2 [Acropora digitifera]